MRDPEKNVYTVIGEGLIVRGEINCASNLKIEGRVNGNVVCLSLIVGKTGWISGDVSTEDVLVEGTIHGQIQSGTVELKDGSMLEGDISSHTLEMEHGATFAGSVHPAKDKIY